MADTVRMTLEEARAQQQGADAAKLAATTEDDVRRYQVEDGIDPDAFDLSKAESVLAPRTVRERLSMTQAEFAAFLRVPLPTLRNWEQGRTLPDPAARTLLNVVAREPDAVRRALGDKAA